MTASFLFEGEMCVQLSPEVAALLEKSLPAFTGLVGALIGAWAASSFSARRERTQRQHAFIERQLSEFYSPMLGLRSEVRAYGELRLKLHDHAEAAWHDLSDGVEPGPEAVALTQERFPEFQALIEYDNTKLTDQLLPCYRKMLDLFREKLWLAEGETRKHYLTLIEFVDVWDRWLAKSLPAEVLQKIGHSEEMLRPFYEHIQERHDRLRASISEGELA